MSVAIDGVAGADQTNSKGRKKNVNDVTKEILNVYEKLDPKGKAAVLRRARRLLARQKSKLPPLAKRQSLQRKGSRAETTERDSSTL